MKFASAVYMQLRPHSLLIILASGPPVIPQNYVNQTTKITRAFITVTNPVEFSAKYQAQFSQANDSVESE